MATHSGILAWEILSTEGYGGLVHRSQVRQDLATKQMPVIHDIKSSNSLKWEYTIVISGSNSLRQDTSLKM